MVCEQCGEQIEDGQEYAEIQFTGHCVHVDCEDEYWEDIKAETVYKTRNVRDEKYFYIEDMEE